MTLGPNGTHLGARASQSLPAMRLSRGVGSAISLPYPMYVTTRLSVEHRTQLTFSRRHNAAGCYRSYSCLPKMSDNVRLWHLSHGIVFAGNREVLYPRLPRAKLHSAATVPEGGDETVTLSSVRVRTVDQSSAVEGSASAAKDAGNRLPDETGTLVVDPEGAENRRAAGDEAATIDDVACDDPPPAILDFRIPPDAFREAKLAEPGSPESFWSYALYRGPGGDGSADAKVKVHYCKTKHTTERVLQQYFMNEEVLGFDLEWAPSATRYQSARQNVSLVQLASQSRIALFHLALYPKNDDLVAPSLKKIMEDPKVTKIGVAIKGDCTRLRNFLKVDSRGILELSHLYKLVKHSSRGTFQHVNKRLVSLATQVEEYLHLPLFKGSDVRSSDWTQQLQMDQIICKPCLSHLTSKSAPSNCLL